MENTEKNNKREWVLHYTIFGLLKKDKDGDRNPLRVRTIGFQATTYEDMLKKTVKILKRSAIKVRQYTSYIVTLLPKDPLPGKKIVTPEELFRLKDKHSYKSTILKMNKEKNIQKYFVQGYGPEALNQLQER